MLYEFRHSKYVIVLSPIAGLSLVVMGVLIGRYGYFVDVGETGRAVAGAGMLGAGPTFIVAIGLIGFLNEPKDSRDND